MTTKRSRSKSTAVRRKVRPRGTPKWIATRPDLDELARRRCLMVLSVLSGERAVTDVIAEAQISRGTYYQMEERALAAMLAALTPSADGGTSEAETPAKRIAELEAKVTKLEREKRRGERLLLLTRKVLKPGRVTTSAGAKRRRRSSTSSGPKPSRDSTPPRTAAGANPSTPTPGGEGAR